MQVFNSVSQLNSADMKYTIVQLKSDCAVNTQCEEIPTHSRQTSEPQRSLCMLLIQSDFQNHKGTSSNGHLV